MTEDDIPPFDELEDEPSLYERGYASTAARPTTKSPTERYKKIGVVAGIVIAVAACSYSVWFVLYRMNAPQRSSTAVVPLSPVPPPAVTVQAQPSIVVGIQKTKNGLRLVVQWENLPSGTTEINLFRSATESGQGVLVGSISIASSSPAGGSDSISIPNADQGGYYYGVAAGNDGSPLYNSPPTPPGEASPTSSVITSGTAVPPPPPPPPKNGQAPNNPSNSGPQPENNPSGTPPNGGNGMPASGPEPAAPTSTPTPTTTYYNPEGGISGIASTTSQGNFWVQHVDQKIQIGWQDLPAGTAQIIVARAPSDDGPWTAVPPKPIATNTAYSIQVVDDTLGDPDYYEMDVYDGGGNIIATDGPVLLQPL